MSDITDPNYFIINFINNKINYTQFMVEYNKLNDIDADTLRSKRPIIQQNLANIIDILSDKSQVKMFANLTTSNPDSSKIANQLINKIERERSNRSVSGNSNGSISGSVSGRSSVSGNFNGSISGRSSVSGNFNGPSPQHSTTKIILSQLNSKTTDSINSIIFGETVPDMSGFYDVKDSIGVTFNAVIAKDNSNNYVIIIKYQTGLGLTDGKVLSYNINKKIPNIDKLKIQGTINIGSNQINLESLPKVIYENNYGTKSLQKDDSIDLNNLSIAKRTDVAKTILDNQGGGSPKLFYKGYYYKVRTEKRKSFIRTKHEGDVSVKAVRQWSKKSKAAKKRC